ncbi:SCO6880 family protein [uncultured Brevibacterium sp.]|jgi:hypothetical protein|uniref:SCO6880 family protein n=1 Tax=uncultured Brevibacterium sp. TaxID=189678 RepID=UPI0025D809F4|nr:SCO6880 family protein [uncultured Brevibacterium sp.]
MSTRAVEVENDVYGNITKPGLSGILGLPLGISLLGVPMIVLVIACMVKQWYLAAFLVAVLSVVAAVLTVVTQKQGRSIYGRLMLKFMQRRKEKAGKHVYIGGPTGRTREGSVRLPGMMARSELTEHEDPYGNKFGLIRLVGPGVKNYSVVIEAYPDGDDLVDQRRVNSMVAHWGAWLAQRGVDEGIRGASVTIESAPDTGLRLQQLMESNTTNEASAFSREVAESIPREYSGGAPVLTTRLTVTFSGGSFDGRGKDRGTKEMADEIATRLPVILSGLFDTGAGTSVRMCTAQDIIDNTRTAYDPTTAAQIEEARAAEGTGLSWEDAGPVFAIDAFDHYRHDRGFSKSWTMWEGPRGHFHSDSLRRLLEPVNGVLRKRVTLLYRPIPAARATELAERGIKDSTFAASQKHGVSPKAQQRYAAAVKSAAEEAQGAGFVRFGMIVTVSVDDPGKFYRLDQQIPALVNHARLRIRPALGNQAVTFQAGLPLGMVLPDHMTLPDELRDWF